MAPARKPQPKRRKKRRSAAERRRRWIAVGLAVVMVASVFTFLGAFLASL